MLSDRCKYENTRQKNFQDLKFKLTKILIIQLRFCVLEGCHNVRKWLFRLNLETMYACKFIMYKKINFYVNNKNIIFGHMIGTYSRICIMQRLDQSVLSGSVMCRKLFQNCKTLLKYQIYTLQQSMLRTKT